VLPVTPPTPANAVITVCDQLNDRLPNVLEGLQSRRTSPRSPVVHAWGGRAVVLRCGVPTPAGFSASSPQTADVNGVTWFQQIRPRDVVWTAIRKTANVELTIPTSYKEHGPFLVDIGAAVAATIP
jgi:hypothetical protein